MGIKYHSPLSAGAGRQGVAARCSHAFISPTISVPTVDWPDVVVPEAEELSDFNSIYQADYDVLSSTMISHIPEGLA